jgi:hypothetical protein
LSLAWKEIIIAKESSVPEGSAGSVREMESGAPIISRLHSVAQFATGSCVQRSVFAEAAAKLAAGAYGTG